MNKTMKYITTFAAGVAVGLLSVKLYDKWNMSRYEYTDDSEDIQGPDRGLLTAEVFVEDDNEVTIVDAKESETFDDILNDINQQVDDDQVISDDGNFSNWALKISPDIPYVIPVSEFEMREDEGYDSVTYTYYRDGFVTDESGTPISFADVCNSLGETFAKHFNVCKYDEIYIRNEKIKMDFSVVRDVDNFVDVASPRQKKQAGI